MDREQYLMCRNSNNGAFLYTYYLENYKGDRPLSQQEFYNFFNIWPGAFEAYNKVVREYDIKFEVIKIEDLETGQVIKYI